MITWKKTKEKLMSTREPLKRLKVICNIDVVFLKAIKKYIIIFAFDLKK